MQRTQVFLHIYTSTIHSLIPFRTLNHRGQIFRELTPHPPLSTFRTCSVGKNEEFFTHSFQDNFYNRKLQNLTLQIIPPPIYWIQLDCWIALNNHFLRKRIYRKPQDGLVRETLPRTGSDHRAFELMWDLSNLFLSPKNHFAKEVNSSKHISTPPLPPVYA